MTADTAWRSEEERCPIERDASAESDALKRRFKASLR